MARAAGANTSEYSGGWFTSGSDAQLGPYLVGRDEGSTVAYHGERVPEREDVGQVFQEGCGVCGLDLLQCYCELSRDDGGQALAMLGEVDDPATRGLVRGHADAGCIFDRQFTHVVSVRQLHTYPH